MLCIQICIANIFQFESLSNLAKHITKGLRAIAPLFKIFLSLPAYFHKNSYIISLIHIFVDFFTEV